MEKKCKLDHRKDVFLYSGRIIFTLFRSPFRRYSAFEGREDLFLFSLHFAGLLYRTFMIIPEKMENAMDKQKNNFIM